MMLDDVFVRKALAPFPVAVGTHRPDDLQGLATWDRTTLWTGTLNTSEILIVSVG